MLNHVPLGQGDLGSKPKRARSDSLAFPSGFFPILFVNIVIYENCSEFMGCNDGSDGSQPWCILPWLLGCKYHLNVVTYLTKL